MDEVHKPSDSEKALFLKSIEQGIKRYTCILLLNEVDLLRRYTTSYDIYKIRTNLSDMEYEP
jgi:hypothetical protein